MGTRYNGIMAMTAAGVQRCEEKGEYGGGREQVFTGRVRADGHGVGQ